MKKRLVLIGILAVALIFPFAVNVQKAEADSILFPWMTKSDTVITLISVVNTAEGDPDIDELLHFHYSHKIAEPDDTAVNAQENICGEYDFKGTTSKDDILTFDASGAINSGLPLFSDTNNDPEFVDSFDLDVAGPVRAYLIVDNDTPSFREGTDTNVDGTLYGEAMIIEVTNGAAWGYIAYNASGGLGTSQDGAVDFSDGLDVLGEVIGNTEETQTVMLPPDVVSTRFFLTPVETDGPNQRVGDANARVQLCRVPDNNGACTSGGMFDNEEGSVSFTNKKDIVCTSGDNLEDLFGIAGAAAWNAFKGSGRQGWGFVVTEAGTVDQYSPVGVDNATDEMIIGKLEFTITGVDLDGDGTNDVNGALNNFLWLRDSETVAGPYGINIIHNETKD